jgi:hypothetical protein
MAEERLSQVIELKMREIGDIIGVDPWVTRTPGEAANYLAGYAKALDDAAKALFANYSSEMTSTEVADIVRALSH